MRTLSLGLALIAAVFTSACAAAQDGLLTKQSAHDFAETVSRLEAALDERGITIFNTIDHSANAAAGPGLDLRPTTLVIFGNPAVGSQLMAASQTMGLDLPLKILIHEDEAGVTHLTYNDMAFLAERHGIDPADPTLTRVAGGLDTVTTAAASE